MTQRPGRRRSGRPSVRIRGFVGYALLPLTAASIAGCAVFLGSDAVCRGGISSVQICVDRREYAPGSLLRVTISNRSGESIFLCGCSLHFAERTELERFGSTYDPSRRCGDDVTLQDILDRMDEIRPGETLTRTIMVSNGVPQGFYRILQWRLDSAGMLLSDEPLRSPEFDVLRSTG